MLDSEQEKPRVEELVCTHLSFESKNKKICECTIQIETLDLRPESDETTVCSVQE